MSSPLYVQIAEHIRAQIANGSWPIGMQLPPISEFGAQFDAAQNTVRAGQDILIDEGLIRREHGRGTFVVATPNEVAETLPEARPEVVGFSAAPAGWFVVYFDQEAPNYTKVTEIPGWLTLRGANGKAYVTAGVRSLGDVHDVVSIDAVAEQRIVMGIVGPSEHDRLQEFEAAAKDAAEGNESPED